MRKVVAHRMKKCSKMKKIHKEAEKITKVGRNQSKNHFYNRCVYPWFPSLLPVLWYSAAQRARILDRNCQLWIRRIAISIILQIFNTRINIPLPFPKKYQKSSQHHQVLENSHSMGSSKIRTSYHQVYWPSCHRSKKVSPKQWMYMAKKRLK